MVYNDLHSLKFNIAIILLTIWVLFWKGYAVWTASKKNQKIWFVVLFVLNTLGILEIFYLFRIAKKKWSDVQKVFLKVITLKIK